MSALRAASSQMKTGGRVYRKRIIIDHTQVSDEDQQDVLVLIALIDPVLTSVPEGGHVASDRGDDIFFTLADGETRLAYEIRVYNPATGELRAWVRIPQLSCSSDTTLYLYYGGSHPDVVQRQDQGVWDAHHALVWHGSGETSPYVEVPHSESLNMTGGITVEAWVSSDEYRPEGLQSIVSKWSPLTTFDTFDAYDAGHTDGLNSIGYFGAVCDGRYIYYAPQHYEDGSVHGIVLRYDTHGEFWDPRSYAAYDAGNTAGLSTKGYYGAIFDGRYVYFVPRHDAVEYHSRVLRYDTRMEFKDPRSWDAYDVGESHSQQGAAFDGRYVYFCPGYAGSPLKEGPLSARVIRHDTWAEFTDPDAWTIYDASHTSGLDVGCFDGGAFDGRYVYFVPLLNGRVLRYDTHGEFTDGGNWKAHDAGQLGMVMCVGAVFDGRYLYFVPYNSSVVVRYDTEGDFNDLGSWASRDVGSTGGLNTGGFDGGFFDGRYVYFVPFVSPPVGEDKDRGYTFHCNFLRYDPRKPFDAPESWEAHDAGLTAGLKTVGYNGGAFDGRYFYLAPWRDGSGRGGMHGRILRYDTVGDRGSFSLRYCDYGHNGGLCAAVPGPSFLVNTEKGPLSVAAHKALDPGWHHIAGVYDGRTIRLFVDGVVVGERSGTGRIHTNDVRVVIGGLESGMGRLRGVIDNVRISRIARSDGWITTAYRNQANPERFAHIT